MSNSQPAVVALVVEDEWLILDLLKEELERAGWSVLATTRGERAVELLGNGGVDLVITDINLAGNLDGWAVASAARKINQGTPVIYTSAYPEEPSRRVEGSDWIRKPYAPEAVVRAANRALSG